MVRDRIRRTYQKWTTDTEWSEEEFRQARVQLRSELREARQSLRRLFLTLETLFNNVLDCLIAFLFGR